MRKSYSAAFFIIARPNGRTHGNQLTIRTTSNSPATEAGEVAVRCSLTLPSALFEKPHLEANITIPEDAIDKQELHAEVAKSIKNVVAKHLLVDMNITVGK